MGTMVQQPVSILSLSAASSSSLSVVVTIMDSGNMLCWNIFPNPAGCATRYRSHHNCATRGLGVFVDVLFRRWAVHGGVAHADGGQFG